MLTIHLNKLLFHAKHGLYQEEKILGNEFEVNIVLKQYTVADEINSIHQTTDYAAVYGLVKDCFSKPTPLLETIAQHICKKILAQFVLVDEVSIQITKLHPPIVHFVGTVGISFVLKR